MADCSYRHVVTAKPVSVTQFSFFAASVHFFLRLSELFFFFFCELKYVTCFCPRAAEVLFSV